MPTPSNPAAIPCGSTGEPADVLLRKQAEELRREREFVRLVLDTDPNLIFVKDADGRFVLVNRALADRYGTTPEALLGKKPGEDIPAPREVPEYRRVEEEVLRTGRPAELDETNTRPDGRVHWFHAIKVPLPLPDAPVHILGIATDITKRKQAEQELREAKQRLQHVIASSPAVLYTLAIEDNRVRGIAWMSENIRELLNYAPEEATAPAWWAENVHPHDRERVLANTNEELFAAERVTNEYRLRHRDGQYRWIHSVIRLVRDAAGNPVEAVGSWLDVTDRMKLEEQFRQSQKMEAVGRLAGGIAHDFNNLLTIINGYSDVLLTQLAVSDPTRSPVVEIRDAGERAARLIAQLLAFSRKSIIEPKLLSLTDVIGQSVRLLHRLIGEDITLITTLAVDLKRVKVDPSQVEQVLLNLAVNARDAMPRGGTLTIETRNVRVETETASNPDLLPGDYVRLIVSDTGTGMSEEVRANMFDPFFTTKEVGQGTGLGLATVYGIVKTYGGHIDVATEVGLGTTFQILFPAAVGEQVVPTSREMRLSGKGSETVLLVEDEPSVRRVARIGLEIQGYRVLEANSGTAAVRVAEAFPDTIHLLVTDVVMPGLGGRDVAEMLRSRRPGLKVLFVSGYTEDAIVRHGISEATDAFLQKPYTSLSLTSKVRAVLDAK